MDTAECKNGVCAVIVTFYPDIAGLLKLLKTVRPQVESIVVIDNASSESDLVRKCTAHCRGATYLGTTSNVGIAAAHNHGVEFARESSARYVLLLDQDSLPAHDMVDQLLRAEESLRSQGRKVAAVGPGAISAETGRSEPFLRRKGCCWVSKKSCEEDHGEEVCETLYLISSGSLISLEVVGEIGLMEEELFIDLVDVEWGFRARAAGYHSFVVCRAGMSHRLGNKEDLPIVPFKVTRHAPVRLYYQTRNYFLLIRKRYVSIGWSLYYLVRHLVPRFFLFAFVSPPRLLNLKMMLRGLIDGLSGKSGEYR